MPPRERKRPKVVRAWCKLTRLGELAVYSTDEKKSDFMAALAAEEERG